MEVYTWGQFMKLSSSYLSRSHGTDSSVAVVSTDSSVVSLNKLRSFLLIMASSIHCFRTIVAILTKQLLDQLTSHLIQADLYFGAISRTNILHGQIFCMVLLPIKKVGTTRFSAFKF